MRHLFNSAALLPLLAGLATTAHAAEADAAPAPADDRPPLSGPCDLLV